MSRPILALALLLPCAAHAAEAPDCSGCHEVDAARFAASVHGPLECLGCHAGAASVPHDEGGLRADCAGCHDEAARRLSGSVHAGARDSRGDRPMDCASCHGDAHAILPGADPASAVHAARQPEACGACHAGGRPPGDGLAVVRPVESYLESVHAQAQREGRGATCSSCHGAHDVRPATDPAAPTAREATPDTCGACHDQVAAQFKASIHGRALAAGVAEAPACTDCHGEHRILSTHLPGSPTFATNVPRETCGRCHGDTRLGEKFGLPLDKVPSYANSYHGLAARSGVQSVAHCGSCHGIHDILPSSDPASHVHAANLPTTCGQCHPGAGTRFGIGPIHVTAQTTRGSSGHWVRRIYLPLILLTVGGMVLHNVLDLVRKARQAMAARAGAPAPAERMGRGFRLAHQAVMVSFPVLVYTGFALTYPETWWARPVLGWESSLGLRGFLHRGAGIVLTAALAGHLIHVAVSRRARHCIVEMLPGRADLAELGARLRHYLGRGPAPHGVRLGYIEKSEYWAFMWGAVLMAGTGFLLWFENLSLSWLPSWVLEAATAVHFYEAVLATLAILVWHVYWVVFDPLVYPMDTTWWSGRAPLARAEERGELRAGTGTEDAASEGGRQP